MRILLNALAIAGTVALFGLTAYVVSVAIQPRAQHTFSLVHPAPGTSDAVADEAEDDSSGDEDLDAADRRALHDVLRQKSR